MTRHETCKDCGHFVCTCNAKRVKGTRNYDTLSTEQAKYVDPKTIQSARTVKTKDGKVEVIVHYKMPKRGLFGRKKK